MGFCAHARTCMSTKPHASQLNFVNCGIYCVCSCTELESIETNNANNLDTKDLDYISGGEVVPSLRSVRLYPPEDQYKTLVEVGWMPV